VTLTMYGIKNCDTVKKARVWLAAKGVDYAFHDYKTLGIDAETLRGWVAALGWEVVLNRAGTTFRALPEADKADITPEKAVALMVAQPSMIKRPMLAGDNLLLAGFKPDVYTATFAQKGAR
jgi:arsenate reductase (glutaredoxin)